MKCSLEEIKRKISIVMDQKAPKTQWISIVFVKDIVVD
jgi:hypothetical protein